MKPTSTINTPITSTLTITNTYACFVQLWRELELVRQQLDIQCKRYCIRRICKAWIPQVTDDFLFEVCLLSHLQGYDLLPRPSLYPYPHRDFLHALVAVSLDIGLKAVNLKHLDAAYTEAYPTSTPIDINKKGKH